MSRSCSTGQIRFEYESGHPLVDLLIDHGVLVTDSERQHGIAGLLCPRDILVWADGGPFIEDGSLIFHSPSICARGINRHRANPGNEVWIR